MNIYRTKEYFCAWIRFALSVTLIFAFAIESVFFPSSAFSQTIELSLPQPGTLLKESPAYSPIMIKGMKVYAGQSFRFDFILDTGMAQLSSDQLTLESNRLIKYFLAALAVPDEQQWVNLSPSEKDRIIPTSFGSTEMGRDLLAQDYLLKQLAASLTDPNTELGKKYWQELNKTGHANFGALNRVWIMPDHAKVVESAEVAFITESHLKVLMQEDGLVTGEQRKTDQLQDSEAKKIFKKWILPQIEKEVNEGQNFALLRQVYHSMIMATWFKRKMRESLLGQNYVGTNKIMGVQLQDKIDKEKIYAQYLAAFKKGVYDTIKEEVDAQSSEVTPRKYFSGGVVAGAAVLASTQIEDVSDRQFLQRASAGIIGKLFTAVVRLNPMTKRNLAKALIPLVMLGSLPEANSAQLSSTTLPNGYKMFLAYTDPGDTPQTIVQKVLDVNNQADREYLNQISPSQENQMDIWDLLIRAGMIDGQGLIQSQFKSYKEYHEFLRAMNAALAKVDVEPPYEEYQDMALFGVFLHLQEKVKEQITLTKEEFDNAARDFASHPHLTWDGQQLTPGQVIDLAELNEHLTTTLMLKKYPLIQSTVVKRSGKDMTIYFFDTNINAIFARTQTKDIFIYLQSFMDVPEMARSRMGQADDSLLAQVYRKAYGPLSDFEIFISKVRELLAHEINHIDTQKIIKHQATPKVGQKVEDAFYVENEIAGYLAQIAGSEYPYIPFAENIYLTREAPRGDFRKFGVAAKIIVDELLKRLNFKDYIATHRQNPKPPDQAGTITGEEYIQLLNQFVLSIPPEQIRQAALELHRERFGVEIDGTPVEIPEAVKAFAKEHYFKAGHSGLEFNPGGIDMNEKALNLETTGSGQPFTVPQTIDFNIPFDGLSPVILQMTPTNLQLLLGRKMLEKGFEPLRS